MQQKTNNPEHIEFTENGIGHFIHMCRETKGYSVHIFFFYPFNMF